MLKKSFLTVWGLALILAGFVSTTAAEDAKGCKDHPLFTRMPNFRIDQCDKKDFDKYEFYVARDESIAVEGAYTYISYYIEEGAPRVSELQIIRNFSAAMKKIGGKVEYEGDYDVYLSLQKDGKEVWVHVHTWNDGEGYDLHIIEKKAMVQEITANEMLDTLNKQGFIALYINFDVDKATIKAESQPIVDQIAEMLKDSPDLKVSIEGHTDNTGTPAHNKTLSQQRADAVMAALVKKGIDAKRLSAVGWGQENPVADNRTEEGKAKNRRVEIVKKN